MRKLLDVLRGARWFEILLAVAAVAALILLQFRESAPSRTETDLERRLGSILSRIDGVGRVEVMVTGEEEDARGVLIVADGAEDLAVCLRLQYAVQTLLGAECSRIEIAPYGE